MDDEYDVWQHAAHVLGPENVRQWFESPALALNGRRPIDVLTTEPDLVRELLTRLDYGTYT